MLHDLFSQVGCTGDRQQIGDFRALDVCSVSRFRVSRIA
jgi:hypothetical protein